MANMRSLDIRFLDKVFDMGGGYVLKFNNRTMAEFFAEELGVDIDDPAYLGYGPSKANRLRCFLQTADAARVVRALKALWKYREALRQEASQEETVTNAEGRLLELIERVQRGAGEEAPAAHVLDRMKVAKLQAELAALAKMLPQSRGYAFEKFLKELFDAYGLEARDAFSLRGEQIDGSFLLGDETYLLEAKWHSAPIGNAELHAFHGKVEQKAAWARGLFVSYSGFTVDGLHAFGRGKRVICMDGLDLSTALSRELPINHVLEMKVRHAAQTGEPFARVRDLFPS